VIKSGAGDLSDMRCCVDSFLYGKTPRLCTVAEHGTMDEPTESERCLFYPNELVAVSKTARARGP